MFSRALVKTPCQNMISGITNANLGQPDHALALAQHCAYIKALEACDLEVTVLPADEAYPDSVFIEDTCLVTRACAIITHPGADTRKGEVCAVRSAMEKFGLPIEIITAPGTLDAGDVMMVGDHFYVGLSGRTNKEGFRQLKEILDRHGMTSSPIPLSSVLHLKTGISYLENNMLLVWGEFEEKAEFQDFQRIRVPAEEGYAANSLWINGRVLVPSGHEKTRDLIAALGYTIIELDVSEYRKLDGGLSCLSLRF